MDWHKRFKIMKKDLGYTNKDIAEITGNTTDSVKNATQPKKEFPRNLKLAIVIYETTKKKLLEEIEIQQGKDGEPRYILTQKQFDRL